MGAITTVEVKFDMLECDCRIPATLEVFDDGEFYCVACPNCVVNVPGYVTETGEFTVTSRAKLPFVPCYAPNGYGGTDVFNGSGEFKGRTVPSPKFPGKFDSYANGEYVGVFDDDSRAIFEVLKALAN